MTKDTQKLRDLVGVGSYTQPSHGMSPSRPDLIFLLTGVPLDLFFLYEMPYNK